MAKKDRTGNRKTRDQRSKKRIPEMGYYLVVTDTEATERCYFNGLHDSLPTEMKTKLVIKVVETKTQNLIEKCKEMTAYEAQYRIPWIVFDRDQVPNFDQIIGCLDILVIFLLSRNRGHAAVNLVIYIERRRVRIIRKQIKICIRDW